MSLRITASDQVVMILEYSLHARQNEQLEAWVNQWEQAFQDLPTVQSLQPEGRFRVSYDARVFKTIERFPE